MTETMPIRISKDIVEELKARKKYDRETYNDVLRRLLGLAEKKTDKKENEQK